MGRTTNKSRRAGQAASARERAAAARAAQRQHDQRRRALTIIGSVVGVAVVIVVIAFVAINHQGSNSASGNRRPAAAAVVQDVTHVSPAALASVGLGNVNPQFYPLKAHPSDPLASMSGKPDVLFVSAEFCPYCAAERWPLIVALSRFGTFHNLSEISSSSTDVDKNTPTFSFYGSTYSSPYLTFSSVENANRVGNLLQKTTTSQQQIWESYDGSQPGYPFLDIAGKYVETSPIYDPSVLAGATQAGIASTLDTPTSTYAKNIDGSATMITAAICSATGGKPGSVCTSKAVTTASSLLASQRVAPGQSSGASSSS